MVLGMYNFFIKCLYLDQIFHEESYYYLIKSNGELVILQRFLTATGIIHALSQLILHAILQHLNQYTFLQPQIHFLQQLTR